MPDTLYENYAINDDDYRTVYDIQWRAQTFTPSTPHKITSVDLKIARIDTPGTLTVSIRATDGYGLPTGGDLCSGTYDADTLGTDTSASCPWTNIPFSVYADLESTMYAIVCRTQGSASIDSMAWRSDETSPTYSGGTVVRSSDSGVTWITVDTADFMFKEYGTIGTAYTLPITAGIFNLSLSAVNLLRPIRNMAITAGQFTLSLSEVAYQRVKTMAISALNLLLTLGNVLFTRSGWNNETKHSATMTNQSKTSATPTNISKNSSSWTNQNKS